MKKIEGIEVKLTITMSPAQIKRLGLTASGDIEEATKILGEVLAEGIKAVASGVRAATCKRMSYLRWTPMGHFDDEEYDWFWKKHGENPWKSLVALQELAQHQYGVLDRLADIHD